MDGDPFYDADGHEARNRPVRCWECPRETFNASGLCDRCAVRDATLEERNSAPAGSYDWPEAS